MRLLLPLTFAVTTALAASPALPHVTFDARLLGLPATVRHVPAEQRGEDQLAPGEPAHVEATFGPRDGSTVRLLEVYPVAGLLAQDTGKVRARIDSLRTLLKGHPAPNRIRGELPFLPLVPAAQLLNGAVNDVDFPGGRGVRFLVAFSQEVAPVTRGQVFYTFQGLTNDGKHYVSLQYGVPLRELPLGTSAPELKGVFDALSSGDEPRANTAWNGYVARTKRQLDALMDDPRLTRLDAFVRSIRVR
ncbi:hypothetical protein [Deinococcus sonorensis]|uniref:Uncharacterized protein n=2 Tax=Deinococcus sonorensis TaxID=309891 RepID=A0AAU7U546_9DEIO